MISLLFFLISIYTIAYLKASDIQAENIFTGSMLLFLSTMTMVTLSDHIMVMWIAIEATTLASAPLIYTHRSAASLEATWKYVLICSVGIAMALLGSVLVTVSMDVGKVDAPISFSAMTEVARQMDPMWLKAGFVFILVGYGTKMGLAPMHTWLPDAHSEAPSPASALLSGVLLNCAYLGIFKTNKVMHAAGLADFPFRPHPDRPSAWSRSWPPPPLSSNRPNTNACWPIPASRTWASSLSAPASADWVPTGR